METPLNIFRFIFIALSLINSVKAYTQNEIENLLKEANELYVKRNFDGAISKFDAITKFLEQKGQYNKEACNSISYYKSFCYLCKAQDCANTREALGLTRFGEKALTLYRESRSEQDSTYCIMLNTIASYHANIHNYKDAINYQKYAVNIAKNVYGEKSHEYSTALLNLSSYYSNNEQEELAIRYVDKTLTNYEKYYSKHDTIFLRILNIKSNYYAKSGNFKECLKLRKEELNIAKQFLKEECSFYATILCNLANAYTPVGEYKEALELHKQSRLIYEKTTGINNPSYYTIISNLAGDYANLGDYSKAIKLSMEVLDAERLYYGENSAEYSTFLENLATYYFENGNYEKAIELTKNVIKIKRERFGGQSTEYGVSLSDMSVFMCDAGEYTEALKYGKESLRILEQTRGNNKLHIANALDNIASGYVHLGNYQEAMNYYQQSKEIRETTLGTNSPCYIRSLQYIANLYSSTFKSSEAIATGKKVLEYYRNKFGEESPKYAEALDNLAGYYYISGDFEQGIILNDKALKIYRNSYGDNCLEYAVSLSIYSKFYSSIGDYDKSRRLTQQILQIYESKLGKQHPKYALALHSLAIDFDEQSNYFKAIEIETEAISIYKNNVGTNNLEYITMLETLAYCYAQIGKMSEAIKIQNEVLTFKEKSINKNNDSYALSLDIFASFQYLAGNIPEAIKLEKKAIEIIDVNNPGYGMFLRNLSLYYKDSNNIKEFSRYQCKSMDYRIKKLKEISMALSISYRNSLWKGFVKTSIQIVPKYANELKTNELNSLAYNSITFSKNFLVRMDNSIQDAIYASNDSSTINLYNDIATNRSILNKAYEKPIAQRYLNTDSLEQVVQTQELELGHRVKEFADMTKSFNITWKDIQATLKPEDIAIEFCNYTQSKDSTIYLALTVEKNDTCPQLTQLCIETQLADSTKVSDLVWGSLADKLKGKKNIYFSPSGMLYKLPIENLEDKVHDGLMSEHYNMYRLSTTSELAMDRDYNRGKNATVYGGIQFSTDTTYMMKDALAYHKVNSDNLGLVYRSDDYIYNPFIDSLSINRGDRKDLMKGQYLPELENTAKEAKEVVSTINKAHIADLTAEGMMGMAATEASFKALSGKKKRIIHVATHGFYHKEDAQQPVNDRMPTLFLDERNQHKYVEDKQMTRSGLFFAGADNRLQGKTIPEGVDDGILTAQEISLMDLRGCDLVVLSACQTGQGDIGSDGVFGLQRGFKKAGVNSILMTLDKVDDLATRLLMTEFYKNYTQGKSKHESLRLAQKYLREYKDENDNLIYKDPKIWGSFILLDALD